MPIDTMYPQLRRVHTEPLIYVIDNFMPDSMCDEIVRRARNDLRKSLVSEGRVVKQNIKLRVSSCSHFNPGELPTLNRRMDKLAPKFAAHKGNARVVAYEPGEYFMRHRDYYDNAHIERIAILFVYLSSGRGGASNFTDISLPPIHPLKGRAVLHFPVFLPTLKPDVRTFHESQPAVDPKYILTTFWLSHELGFPSATQETVRLYPDIYDPKVAFPDAHRLPLKGPPL